VTSRVTFAGGKNSDYCFKWKRGNLLYKLVSCTNLGSAARNVTETKFIWKNRKLKRPYKRSFLIQMALCYGIDKIRTYRTQTPYTFFGHKAFTAISYPGEGAKSQPTG
jgi:hypothetical protein